MDVIRPRWTRWQWWLWIYRDYLTTGGWHVWFLGSHYRTRRPR